MIRSLVVIPSEPLELYKRKGIYTWLESYYNPDSFFDKVYLISPLETERRFEYGMYIIPAKSSKHFKSLVKRIKPVCVRTYGAYWATSYGIINKINKIPVIASIHDPKSQYIHRGISYADYIFSMSKYLIDVLKDRGVSENKIILTGNRVDFDIFRAIREFKSSGRCDKKEIPKRKNVTSYCRLTEQKNLLTVLKALKYLPKDYFLVIIGKGHIPEFQQYLESRDFKNRIFHKATVPNNELPFWYNACDVFVVPSLWEGFGVVFLEAAACKVKIVTSDIQPMNDILKSDGNIVTLIKKYKDPKVLSKAIIEILQTKPIDNSNYNSIRSRFSKEIIEEVEINFYNKLINGELIIEAMIDGLAEKFML